ncbi:MAG: rod shape-determining protein MreC [Actinobacteria bacterium]|nr:MAG: rod shape-determining protein MreC [Actinomycetota bacterium]
MPVPGAMIRMFDRSKRVRWLLVILIVVSLAIITIDYRGKGNGPFERIGHVALTILSPIQHGLVTIFRPVGNFFAGFTEVPTLRAHVSTLQRQVAELRAGENTVAEIERENESLRKLLGIRDRYNLNTVAAQVIGVSPSNFERTVFIDRGSRAGVLKDMPVIAGDGLVGRVIRVGPSTSEILLLIDRTSAVASRVVPSGETGLLEGDGSENTKLELFNPDAKLGVGDRVVTSGYDRGLYPPGIPIGTVVSAPPAQSNLSRVVAIQPYVDFSSLDYVLLIIGQTATSSPSPSGTAAP